MRHPNATKPKWPALLAALLVTALVAGCTGPLTDDNRAPVARLAADKDRTWIGETVGFDLSGSYDPDGRITYYLLELGDGTTRELGSEDDLRVTHTYTRGGDYQVRLTVTDDAGESEAKSDRDSVRVIVNERSLVQGQVVAAGNLTGNVSDEMRIPFTVAPKPVRYELAVNATNLLTIGGSEIEISVLDAVGAELTKKSVTLASGATQLVELEDGLSQAGSHSIRLRAVQGGASVDGQLLVFYG